ncbi:Uncharacterized protein FKW44_024070, partial [Caligus rogercresseyi]
NVTSLKASIKSEMNKLDPAEVSTACGRFRHRLEDILEAEGGHIEKLSYIMSNKLSYSK